jgi:ribosome-binding factor A
MPSEIRLKRIQDQIKQILSEILETKVNDPRLEQVYITDVSVDRELDYANIYVSAIDGSGQAEDILDGLKTASGFIRYNLSQEINLRVMPKLRFFWDDTPERADRIEALLSVIRQEREALGQIEDESEQRNAEENDEFSN